MSNNATVKRTNPISFLNLGLAIIIGCLPVFSLAQRVLLDRDDPALNEQIQADNLALTQHNSVERMLTKYYRTGVWDGTRDNVEKAYQKHRQIFLEGCYRREDYY